jgi:Sec-independent protein translocase protein TatA
MADTDPNTRILIGVADVDHLLARVVRDALDERFADLTAKLLVPSAEKLEAMMSEITEALKQLKQAAIEDRDRQQQALADRDAQLAELQAKIDAGLQMTDEDRALQAEIQAIEAGTTPPADATTTPADQPTPPADETAPPTGE